MSAFQPTPPPPGSLLAGLFDTTFGSRPAESDGPAYVNVPVAIERKEARPVVVQNRKRASSSSLAAQAAAQTLSSVSAVQRLLEKERKWLEQERKASRARRKSALAEAHDSLQGSGGFGVEAADTQGSHGDSGVPVTFVEAQAQSALESASAASGGSGKLARTNAKVVRRVMDRMESERERIKARDLIRTIYKRGQKKGRAHDEYGDDFTSFPLKNLSSDIVYHIYTFLNISELGACSCTCRAFGAPAEDAIITVFDDTFGEKPNRLPRRTVFRMLGKAHFVNAKSLQDLYLWACARGYIDYVLRLLDDGAMRSIKGGVNATKSDGTTALHLATEHGYKHLIQVLLKAEADPTKTTKTGQHILHTACKAGRHKILRFFVDDVGIPIDLVDTEGMGAVHYAAAANQLRIVNMLLEYNADPNLLAGDTGKTAMWMACEAGHVDMVRLLLEHDADVNQAAQTGKAPLYVASENANHEMVELLLEYGADVKQETARHKTALYPAAELGHVKVVKHLLRYCDVEDLFRLNTYGTTPMWIAAKQPSKAVKKLFMEFCLMKHGAFDENNRPTSRELARLKTPRYMEDLEFFNSEVQSKHGGRGRSVGRTSAKSASKQPSRVEPGSRASRSRGDSATSTNTAARSNSNSRARSGSGTGSRNAGAPYAATAKSIPARTRGSSAKSRSTAGKQTTTDAPKRTSTPPTAPLEFVPVTLSPRSEPSAEMQEEEKVAAVTEEIPHKVMPAPTLSAPMAARMERKYAEEEASVLAAALQRDDPDAGYVSAIHAHQGDASVPPAAHTSWQPSSSWAAEAVRAQTVDADTEDAEQHAAATRSSLNYAVSNQLSNMRSDSSSVDAPERSGWAMDQESDDHPNESAEERAEKMSAAAAGRNTETQADLQSPRNDEPTEVWRRLYEERQRANTKSAKNEQKEREQKERRERQIGPTPVMPKAAKPEKSAEELERERRVMEKHNAKLAEHMAKLEERNRKIREDADIERQKQEKMKKRARQAALKAAAESKRLKEEAEARAMQEAAEEERVLAEAAAMKFSDDPSLALLQRQEDHLEARSPSAAAGAPYRAASPKRNKKSRQDRSRGMAAAVAHEQSLERARQPSLALDDIGQLDGSDDATSPATENKLQVFNQFVERFTPTSTSGQGYTGKPVPARMFDFGSALEEKPVDGNQRGAGRGGFGVRSSSMPAMGKGDNTVSGVMPSWSRDPAQQQMNRQRRVAGVTLPGGDRLRQAGQSERPGSSRSLSSALADPDYSTGGSKPATPVDAHGRRGPSPGSSSYINVATHTTEAQERRIIERRRDSAARERARLDEPMPREKQVGTRERKQALLTRLLSLYSAPDASKPTRMQRRGLGALRSQNRM